MCGNLYALYRPLKVGMGDVWYKHKHEELLSPEQTPGPH